MKSNEFFNGVNWWYLHSISANFVFRACKENISEEGFNRLIVEYFRENNYKQLKSVVSNWSRFRLEKELYSPIKQILSAHMRCEYNLTVPAMIPIVERLILTTYNNHYEIKQHKTGKAISEFKEGFSEDKIYYTNFLFILKMFFESGDFGELDDFNRHKIVHGQTVAYGKEIYSLKLLLAIDEILRFRYLIQSVSFDNKINKL